MKLLSISHTPAKPLLAALLGPILCSGCHTTVVQQRQAELAVLDTAAAASSSTLDAFRSNSLPPDYDLHLYIAYAPLNKALGALGAYQFPVPGVDGATAHIRALRLTSFGTLPSASVSASVEKGDLKADVGIQVVLVPELAPDRQPALRFKVLAFTPVVSWNGLEFTKSEFVHALLAVEVNKLTARLPLIVLPVSQQLSLGGPALQKDETISTGRDSTLVLRVTVPSTAQQQQIRILNHVFMPDGLHLFAGVAK